MLFSEVNWDTISADLVTDGFTQYSSGYDGYALYQEMGWPSLTLNDEGRGLFTGIPSSGFTGWVCYWKTGNTYDCKSKFIAESQFIENTAPDYTKTIGDSTGWFCKVTQGSRDVAICIRYLPEEASSYATGEYRWSPQTDPQITQLGYVADQNNGDSWRILSSVKVQGAISGVVTASAALLACTAALSF